MTIIEIDEREQRERDVRHVASFVCREAERGGEPCYQCKDFVKRLITAADPGPENENGFGLIHFIDELLREGDLPAPSGPSAQV